MTAEKIPYSPYQIIIFAEERSKNTAYPPNLKRKILFYNSFLKKQSEKISNCKNVCHTTRLYMNFSVLLQLFLVCYINF